MRIILIVCSALFYIVSVYTQTPQKMSYQAVVRNSSNKLVSDVQIGIQISILQGSASGNSVYVETQTPTTNDFGLINIEIGEGLVVSGNFAAINWAEGPYFIKTETDLTGGTTYTITGTSQLLSVPYALFAKTAETLSGTTTETDPIYTAWDKDYADLINYPTSISDFLLDANSQNVTNLANPVNPNDAVTKAYVDSVSESIKDLVLAAVGLTDTRDGNHYNVVKIGEQIWMAENLKYLPSVSASSSFSDTIAYIYVYGYDGTDVNAARATTNYGTYGALYNWTAAMDGEASSSLNPSGVQGVCPSDWHLPSNTEWNELIDNMGGVSVAGGKLKEEGTAHWASPNTSATNEVGFTALPGGWGYYFSSLGDETYFWTASSNSSLSALAPVIFYDETTMVTSSGRKCLGYSVRCVKD